MPVSVYLSPGTLTVSGPVTATVRVSSELTDAPVSGMYGVEETFVQHLRLCFRHGGFRGHIESEPEGDVGWKVAPRMKIASKLAEGLLAV